MTSLIAILSSGKGTWAQVLSLIKAESWDKIYLICNDFANENFKIDMQNVIKLKINEKDPSRSVDALAKFFKKDVKDFEVAVNLFSGSGLEHMAVLSAILKSGLGIRLVYSQNNQLKEFEIMESFVEE